MRGQRQEGCGPDALSPACAGEGRHRGWMDAPAPLSWGAQPWEPDSGATVLTPLLGSSSRHLSEPPSSPVAGARAAHEGRSLALSTFPLTGHHLTFTPLTSLNFPLSHRV